MISGSTAAIVYGEPRLTHDVDVIRAMAHDVVVMKDGRIVESGTVREVLDAPREAYTRTLVAAAS